MPWFRDRGQEGKSRVIFYSSVGRDRNALMHPGFEKIKHIFKRVSYALYML